MIFKFDKRGDADALINMLRKKKPTTAALAKRFKVTERTIRSWMRWFMEGGLVYKTAGRPARWGLR